MVIGKVDCGYRLRTLSWLLRLNEDVSVWWYLKKCDYCPVLLEAKVCWRTHGYLLPGRCSVCSGPCLFCLHQMDRRELEGFLWALMTTSAHTGKQQSRQLKQWVCRNTDKERKKKPSAFFFNAAMKKYISFNSSSLKLCIQNIHKLEFDYSDENIRRK